MRIRNWTAALLALILVLTLCGVANAGDDEIVSAPLEAAVEEVAVDLSVGEAEVDLTAPERGKAFDSAVSPATGSLVTITKPTSVATITPGDVELWCRFDSNAFDGDSANLWKFASISVEVLLDGALYDNRTISVGSTVSFTGEGRQYATLSLTEPGEYTIRASVPGSPDVWDSVKVTVGAAPTDAPEDLASPDAPTTTRQPITADTPIVITSPAHSAKLEAGSYPLRVRFNLPSGESDFSKYNTVSFHAKNSNGLDSYIASFGGHAEEAESGEEFTLFIENFGMAGIYTIEVWVDGIGTPDRVEVAVAGPVYPWSRDSDKFSINPKQSEYTIDLAQSDTVNVEFTLSSSKYKNSESYAISWKDYCADFGEIIEYIGAHQDNKTYDERTERYNSEAYGIYRGLKVGRTRLHLYVYYDSYRYDHHAVTINVIDSSENQTPAPTVTPTSAPTDKPTPTAKPVSLANAKVTVKAQVYTGKALTPAVTVKLNGKTLKNGVDYTVGYRNNRDIGKASVTVKGKGKYTGTAKGAFKINPKLVKGLKLKAGSKQLTASWTSDMTVTGYHLQYGLKKNFKGAKTVTVKKAATVNKTIAKLKAKKTYYVRIRAYKTVKGVKYYSAWSKPVSAKTQ